MPGLSMGASLLLLLPALLLQWHTALAQVVARPQCTNPLPSPLYVGVANATNLDRLHRALNGWRNCDGTIIFTEPGAVFVLEGGYSPTNVTHTLDASGLAAPVTLTHRGGGLAKGTLLSFQATRLGIVQGVVARNIAFANNVRSAINGTGAQGSVIQMPGGSALFESCRFLNNSIVASFHPSVTAGACNGGALRFQNCTSLRFDDCVFEGNSATCDGRMGTGGAVSIGDIAGPVAFNRCTFTGNKVNTTLSVAVKAASVGGAVFVELTSGLPQAVSFSSCHFEGNEVQGMGFLTNAVAALHVGGGAVGMDPSPAKINPLSISYTDCSFVSNSATGSLSSNSTMGLQVYGGAVLSHTNATSTVRGCTFNGNTAVSLSNPTTTPTPAITATVLAGAGALYVSGLAATIESCTFFNNSAASLTEVRGGAAGVHATLSSITNTTWTANRASATGPFANRVNGGGLATMCRNCRLSLSGCVLVNNSATLSGTISSSFVLPVSTAEGGGMYLSGISHGLGLSDVTFHENTVIAFAQGDSTQQLLVEGGGMCMEGTVAANLLGMSFLRNAARIEASGHASSQVNGGGLALISVSSAFLSRVNSTGALFRDNTAGGVSRNFGGAFYRDFYSKLQDEETVLAAMTPLAGVTETSFNDWSLVTTLGKVTTTSSTHSPTAVPTFPPTRAPTTTASTLAPTAAPSSPPSAAPSPEPSPEPSQAPTTAPSPTPTSTPSSSPSSSPSNSPSALPSATPSASPSSGPTASPSASPSSSPSSNPTATPSESPSLSPSVSPSSSPSSSPSEPPTNAVTTPPSAELTGAPTAASQIKTAAFEAGGPVTNQPTKIPRTRRPTRRPTKRPTKRPTRRPTKSPQKKKKTKPRF